MSFILSVVCVIHFIVVVVVVVVIRLDTRILSLVALFVLSLFVFVLCVVCWLVTLRVCVCAIII